MSTTASRIVTASAGSGKTHTLTTRLIELLLDKVKSENIIAQTFTKKAAGEIYARVITRLINLSSDPSTDPSITRKLPDGLALETLRGLIAKQDRLRIETLDSFFADLCKSHFIEMGLAPNWQIADDKQIEKIITEALKASIQKIGIQTFRLLLDFLLSNKTPNRVLEPILKELREFRAVLSSSDRSSWGNLAVNEKAIPLEEVKAKLLSVLDHQEEIKFDSRGWDSIKSIVRAIDEKDLSYICKSKFVERILSGDLLYYKKIIPEEVVQPILLLGETLGNEVIKAANARTLSLLGILTVFQNEYQELIKETGKLSFSDIAELTNEKVGGIDTTDLFSRLSMSLEHLLLDEFQDTSPIQWNIIENISKHILESSGTENSVFIVGDAKQAIYSWRGGSAEVFNHLRNIAPHIPEESLETNYRSHPGIIEFVNTVFSGLEGNEALTKFSEPIESWLKEFKTHIAIKKNSEHVVYASAYPEMPEEFHKYEHVINDIIGVQASDPTASIAVLLRTNSQLEEFGHYLRLCGLNYTSSQTSKLDSYYPVQLLISLVILAEHPGDKLSYLHLQESKLNLEKILGSEAKDALSTSKLIREKFLTHGFSLTLSQLSSQYLRTCSSESERNIIYMAISIAMEFERKGLTNWSEWIERISSTKIPASSESNLQLMSIHKSKGLEFDYVFIPELDDPLWKIQNLKLLKKEDNAFNAPTTIIRKPTEPEVNIVPQLRELRDEWINSQIREGLSLLYVAITRAIKGLFIYLDASDKNVSEFNLISLTEILRASLFYADKLDPEDILYQSFRQASEKDKKESEVGSSTHEMLELKWSSINEPTACELKSIHKSDHKTTSSKAGHSLTAKDLIAELTGSRALNFGTIVHKCLEKVDWLDCGNDLEGKLEKILCEINLSIEASTKAEVLKYLLKAFSHEAVKALFLKSTFSGSSTNPKLLQEVGFLHSEGDNLLAGNIDRLILMEQDGVPKEILIYDFKTDSRVQPEAHKEQLASYKHLAQTHWGMTPENIKCFLVYLENGELIAL